MIRVKKYFLVITVVMLLLVFIPACSQDTSLNNDKAGWDINSVEEKPKNSTINIEKATVTKVVDGDTIYVQLANGAEAKVRLILVDTPESTTKIEPYGKEAAYYTKSQLLGRTIYLEKDVSNNDRFGRLLKYLWLEKPLEISENELRTKLFNARLLLDGYAQLATYPPDNKYLDYFKQFQVEAQENNTGLWGIDKKASHENNSTQQTNTMANFLGSKQSDKYHQPTCSMAKKIRTGNQVWFKDKAHAQSSGFKPCGVCKP